MERLNNSQWLSSVFTGVEDLMVKAANPAYRFMSKSDVLETLDLSEDDITLMCQIATRLQIIASNIEARTEPKFKLVTNHG